MSPAQCLFILGCIKDSLINNKFIFDTNEGYICHAVGFFALQVLAKGYLGPIGSQTNTSYKMFLKGSDLQNNTKNR